VSSGEQPVIGIYRTRRYDVGSEVPAERTGSLLRKGARVILLGGRQELRHERGSSMFLGPLYEVTLDRYGDPAANVAPRDGEVMLDAIYNAARHLPSGIVPALNSDRLRKAADKRIVYTHTLPELSPHTRVVTPATWHADLTDHFAGDELIVKPVGTSGGRDVLPVAKLALGHELAARFRDQPDTPQVVQERIKTSPWPTTIRPAYPAESDRLHGGRGQEMRMFVFNNEYVPMARVVSSGNTAGINRADDGYVALDPLTVPDAVYARAYQACHKLRQASGDTEIGVAVDFMYGSRPQDGRDAPNWWLSEVNYIDPQPPDINNYVAIAHQLNDARSTQLIRMAQTGVQ